MKLILLVALLTFTFAAVGTGGIVTIVTSKLEDKDFSCKAAVSFSGAGDGGSNAAAVVVFGVMAKATAAAIDTPDTFWGCYIATASTGSAAPIVIAASNSGTCGNYTATSTSAVTATAWTATEYVLNCTEGTATTMAALNCAIYFDMGVLAFNYADATPPTFSAINTDVTLTANVASGAPTVADGVLTITTGDTACEDKSASSSVAYIGAASLIAATFF